MRTLILTLTLFSAATVWASDELTIAGWKETKGITQSQALGMARTAIHQDIAVDEDGEVCGVEDMWNWERERDLIADYPQERGEVFAIIGYARGPHPEMGCSATHSYDCRVVFNKPKKKSVWKTEYVECEPTGIRFED